MILDDSDDNLVVEASESQWQPQSILAHGWPVSPVSSTDLYFSDYARRIHDALHDYYLSSPDRSLYCLAGRWATGGSLSSLQRNRISYADRTFLETEGIPFHRRGA